MKDCFDVLIDEDGTITTIYQPGVEQYAKDLGGQVVNVTRLSVVEWEARYGGWTVRSAHDYELAIRQGLNVAREGPIAVFAERQQALDAEEKSVWKLLKEKE